MNLSPESQARIAILRQKAKDGTLEVADMKEAIELLRADRRSAAVASSTSKAAKAKVSVPSAADLLSEMEGL